MEIKLDSASVVNARTGEVSAPSEYVDNLRAIETSIQRADGDIVTLKADLKAAREAREKLVAQLRAAVRDGTVLPLFEAAEEETHDDADDHAGLDTDDDPDMPF
jgi:hypothetical protein